MTTKTETSAPITYRKTKAGEWVAYGPAELIVGKTTVYVTKKDGTEKPEYVSHTGRTFVVGGVEMVYAYLDRGKPAAAKPWWNSPRERALAERDDPTSWS